MFSTNRKPKEHYNLEQKTLVTTEIKRLNTKKNNLRTIVRNHREAMVSVASAGNSSVFLPSEHHANEKCGQNREAEPNGNSALFRHSENSTAGLPHLRIKRSVRTNTSKKLAQIQLSLIIGSNKNNYDVRGIH